MAMIFFIFWMQKGGFGGFETGHFFEKPRDGRGLELTKSRRGMINEKFIT